MSEPGGASLRDPSSHAGSTDAGSADAADAADAADDGLDDALDAFLDWAEERLDRRGVAALGPGRTLGDFELVAPIGSGGMGVVWEAAQISVPGRIVAVKILRAELAGEGAAERFRREVEAIGRLDHRAIVPVVSAGVDAGVPYYAMKSVSGSNLAQLLRRLRESGDVPRDTATARRHVLAAAGSVSTPSGLGSEGWRADWTAWAAHVALELADALQHAHEQGVVHRDVKPANVLVTPSGHPVLVDFGLASTDASATLTAEGDFIGTLAYAAPEQVLGESVDTRADVWGVGAVLYELLTLSRPFDAPDRAALIEQLARGELPDPGPLAPGDLHTVVTTALTRDRARRYATPGDLAHDLRAWLGGRPIRARPPSLARRTLRRVRRHPRLLAAAVTLLAVFAASEGRARWRASRLVAEAGLAWREATGLDGELRRLRSRIDDLLHDDGLRAARAIDTRPLGELRAQLARRRDERSLARERAEALYLDALATAGAHAAARDGLARLTTDTRADALEEALDLRRPDEFAALDERLRRLAEQGAPVALPASDGPFRVEVSPAGAQVQVYTHDPRAPTGDEPARIAGPAPLSARLEYGSYRARIERPGHAPVDVPFVVRPADAPRPPDDGGAADDPVAPWARVAVRLRPSADVPDGWLHVPGGWSLIGQPPRWRRVDDVLMQRHEVTYADWLEFVRARDGAPGTPPPLPRFPGLPHIARDERGVPQLDPVVHDPRWPVRAVSRSDVYAYIGWLAERDGAAHPQRILDLPSELEWERAASGADGRAYPWGEDFRWDACAFAWSRDDPHAEPWPVPVGRFHDDRSPFGVRDMAGSIAELTRSTYRPGRDSVAVRGGSYLSGEVAELGTRARREVHNAPESDVGFRLVQRPLPEWMRAAPPEPGPYADDFERADSESPGDGWIEGAGSPLRAASDGGAVEQVALRRGRLELQGGVGNFSEPSTAWRAWTAPGPGAVLRARVRVTARTEQPTRSAQLSLVDGRLRGQAGLVVFPTGGLALLPSDGAADAEPTPWLAGHWLDVELRVEPPWLDVRVGLAGWSVAEVQRRARLDGPLDVRFLQLEAGNYDGVRLEVEELSLEGLTLER